jgi:tetratricopeptide (TPR) repeat protein
MVLSNDCGYLVAAWWPPECKEASNWSKGVMGNVEFFPPRGIPSSPSKQRANAMGLLYNDLGINKYSKAEFEPAIKYFEMSLEHALDEVVVSNLVEAYFDNNQEESARTALEKHLGNFPESLALGNLKANLCLHQGESELAMNLLSDLFRNGYDDEDQLLKYLNLAVDSEQFDQAIETLEHVLRERPTAVAQRWYALMHSRNGQHEEAIRLMIKLTKEYPEDTDCQYALGDAYEMAERYNEAIEVCDELIKKHPRDTDLWFMKGRSELELGRYAQAADAFQKILVAQPGNEEAKRYMQHVSALLGQGDRSQISTLVEPVPLPTEISEMIQAAETQEAVADEEEHDRVDIYNVTGIAYQKGIQRRITFYRKFKVLTTAGADNYSTISWPFDPLTERPYVNQLAVFNQTGEQVAEGSPESYYVLDDSEADHASQDRRVHITVPNLKSGYSVAFAITIESLAAPEKFGFEKRFLAAGYPMRLGAVYFQGDLASVNHVAANLKSESVHPNLQVWSIERPTVFEWEAQQAPIDDFLSSVQIADQGTNWEEVGREYLERIAPKMQLDPQTRTQAEKITEGMAENSEKTAAIAKYIQAECTYKALEFGVRSQMPNSAARVLKNGYGDCKDHSVLLAQMLRSVGIEAHLALINSSEIISRELPSLEQFDHMIVYLPGGDQGDGAVFLDATEKHAVPRIPCTPGLEDKFSLVLDPQKPILVRTPSYGEKAGVVRVERVVEFQPQSDSEIIGLTVNESLFLNSYTSRGMRYYLQSFSSRERRKAIRDLFSKGDKIRIRKLTIDNLEQPTKDLVLNLEYSLPGAYHRVGNSALNPRLTGSIPALWEKYYLDQDFDDFRATPFQISMPLSVVSKTEFRLPEGLQLENAQKLTTQGSSGILQWTTRLNQHELGFAFESLIDRGVGKFPANAFPKYYEALQQAIGAAKSPIKLGQAKSALRN